MSTQIRKPGYIRNKQQQTANPGTGWVKVIGPVGNAPESAYEVTVYNDSGTDLKVRRNGGGDAVTVYNNTSQLFSLVASTGELEFQRSDTSDTQVTFVVEIKS